MAIEVLPVEEEQEFVELVAKRLDARGFKTRAAHGRRRDAFKAQ